MITPQWVDRLERSAVTHGETFLHHLHVGIASAERRNYEAAVKSFEKSISLRPTAVAHRNLAVVLDDTTDRATHYQAAWTIAVAADLARDPAAGHLQVCLCMCLSVSMHVSWYVQPHPETHRRFFTTLTQHNIMACEIM